MDPNFSKKMTTALDELFGRVSQADLDLAAQGVLICVERLHTEAEWVAYREGIFTSLKLLIAVSSRQYKADSLFEALVAQGETMCNLAIALAANICAWDLYVEEYREQSARAASEASTQIGILAKIKAMFTHPNN